MIIDYDSKYDESVKDLLVELQQHIADLDKEGYNIVGEGYREKCFEKVMKNIEENNGKILLYEEDNKIVGLIIGIVYNEAIERFDFKAPKRGRITDLVVTKEYRGKHVGKELLERMKKHLKYGIEEYSHPKKHKKASKLLSASSYSSGASLKTGMSSSFIADISK